ncbi:MAG: hypothetical protein K9K62_02310 [Desulfobacteraceae bacterium]|nr:hypothetical protein [Desulfobacteraceae bacterium]
MTAPAGSAIKTNNTPAKIPAKIPFFIFFPSSFLIFPDERLNLPFYLDLRIIHSFLARPPSAGCRFHSTNPKQLAMRLLQKSIYGPGIKYAHSNPKHCRVRSVFQNYTFRRSLAR